MISYTLKNDKYEIKLPSLTFGTSDFMRHDNDEVYFELLDTYCSCGGWFIDTARVYCDWLENGHNSSEGVIGRWIKARNNRDKIVLATKGGHPAMGFTPDGNFPLVNGELGILVFDLAQKFSSKPVKEELRLTKFEAGTAHNAVPEKAKAVISGDKANFDEIAEKVNTYREEKGYEIISRKQGAALVIEATGKAAHGAHPDLGLNAASILFDFLGRIGFASEELNDFIDFYNNHIGFDLYGERMGCNLSDDVSGPLIFNVGLVNINEDIASVTVNVRYPVTYNDEDVLLGIQQELGDTAVGIVTRMVQPAVYMEADNPMVMKLMQAYRDETGDADAKPMVIRGGTYAKMMNNILAFGAEFPHDENTMHQANEKFSIDSFIKMTKIYARALYALCFEEESE